MKLMDFAFSSLSECCTDGFIESWKNDKDALLVFHALVVNHVKFVLAFEGLTSVHNLYCKCKMLYPTCVELISSCVESQKL